MRYLAVALLAMTCGVAWAGDTVVVTTASDGTPANADIYLVWISGDGTVAAWVTAADNLVAGDTNGMKDLFRKDLATGVTTRVSLGVHGEQLNPLFSGPNYEVMAAAISRDGTYFAFRTYADVFTASGPRLANPAIYFATYPSGPVEAVLYDPTIGEGHSTYSFAGCLTLSADGRYVCFMTDKDGLDPDYPDFSDVGVYVYDRQLARYELVTVSTQGTPAYGNMPAMTPDGRYVVFASASDALVPGDTNTSADIFVRDRWEQATTRVSLTSDGREIPLGGGQDYPSISADGRFVGFISRSPELTEIDLPITHPQAFVRDLVTGATILVTTGDGVTPSNGTSWYTYVSSRTEVPRAMYQSSATDLVPGLTDGIALIYERDLVHGMTDVISCTSEGEALPPVDLFCPSETGEVVAFVSEQQGGLFRGLGVAPKEGYKRTRGPFWDVGSRHWAVTQIEQCYGEGIVGGYSDHSYRPTDTVTRDQMAVYIARALAGGEEAVPEGPPTPTFSDIPTDHWAYRHVEYAVSQSVVGGYEDGTYRPTLTVTRDAMAVFVARGLAGGDAGVPSGPPTATFSDVATDHWAYRHVEYCVGANVVSGYPDGTYRPGDAVDRAQMAVYVKRAFLP